MRHELNIDLPVRNEWANVELIRTSILNCFTAVFSDVDGCRAVAMVVGELLENAIKYGAWEGREAAFRLHVAGDDHGATVVVENPVAAGARPAGDLLDTIARINGYGSAEDAYRARLLEVATEARNPGSSRLGLARVAYEGNCRLSAAVEGTTARVTAELRY